MKNQLLLLKNIYVDNFGFAEIMISFLLIEPYGLIICKDKNAMCIKRCARAGR